MNYTNSLRAVKMLPVFLLAVHQMNYAEYLTSINQPILDLFSTRKFSDVQILIDDPYENGTDIIDHVYRTISQILPTAGIFLNNSTPRILPSFRVTRETLILYVYSSKTAPDPQQSKDIVDVIVHNDIRPKVLLLTILEEKDCNFQPLLKRMWDNLLPDAMILELPKFIENRSAVMVHQYNPFAELYDRRPYASDMEWFPNKLQNLYGSPMKMYVFDRPGSLNVKVDSEEHSVTIDGPDAKVLEVFARSLNFTPKMVYIKNPNLLAADIKHVDYEVEIFMVTLPLFLDKQLFVLFSYTLPLTMEKWCPVVPILYKFVPIEKKVIVSIFINWVIITIIWAVSIVLKFDRRSWQPLNIYGVFIAMSVSMKPTKLTEKIVFLTILCASSLYSTNLYADMTTSNLQTKSPINYDTFYDLDKSGLTPAVFHLQFNVTFISDDQSFLALKKKATLMLDFNDCVDQMVKHKNVTCFFEEKLATTIIYSYMRRGEKVMAICNNLCYFKPPVGYFMKKNSMYTDRFTEIMIRLQMSGIRQKWDLDYMGKFSPRKTYFMHIDEQQASMLVSKLIRIGLYGYFISLLMFFAEVMINCIKNAMRE